MLRRFLMCLCILIPTCALGQSGKSTAVADRPLGNDDVLAMVTAGVSESAVIAAIDHAPTESLDTASDALGRLAKRGVSKAVIDAMVKRATQRSVAAASAAQSHAQAPAGKLTPKVFPQAKPDQAASKIVEPEYIGVFAALDPSTGALIELERKTTTQDTKRKGFAGVEVYLTISGERSPVRFKADALPAFVVRVASQQSDPQSSIRFIVWRQEKGARRIIVGKAGAFRGSKVGADESLLPFNATRYGETSFKIIPAQPLPPGEYALGPPGGHASFAGGHDSFAFGIDPASSDSPTVP